MSEKDLPKKVVAQATGSLVERYKIVESRIKGARDMFADAQKNKAELWDELLEKHDLDRDKNYTINTETGEIQEGTSFSTGGGEN